MALPVLISSPLSAKAFFMDDFFNDLESHLEESYSETADGNGNQVYINNDVSVTANTGGNVVSGGGEIVEGKAKVKIKTETVINGKVIDPINIETEANEASVKSEIKADGGVAQVEREIKVGSETATENFEVDLGNSEENAEVEIKEPAEANNLNPAEQDIEQDKDGEEVKGQVSAVLHNWWPNFAAKLKSFFQSIFSIF